MKRFSPVISLVFFSFIVFFSACEVGLGEAVDTQAPNISITYPEGKSVIRDRFVLAGECSDDQSVASVSVTVLDSENNPVGDSLAAAPKVEASADGSGQVWSVEINAKNAAGYPLKDGKYTFCATATDGAGRKSQTAERQFEIDNTAPVFRINSPGSTETETAYGSVLKVEGEIAEAHSVKTMTLVVYGEDGTEKASWTEENINTAGSTKVTFAKYVSGAPAGDALYNNYRQIYDIEKGGDQSLSCSVMLTDSAAVYQSPSFVPSYARAAGSDTPAASGGNATSDVWLYDDIYGSDAEHMLMGTKAAEVWGKSFEISDFMNLLNGTETYDAKNQDGKTVLEVLEAARINTAEACLKIKLNKDANPTYTIMGYSFDDTAMTDGEWNLSPASRGGMLTLKADAGLDGVQFSPETITVYLFGPFEQRQLSDTTEAGVLDRIYRDPELYAKENAERTAVLYDGKNGVSGGGADICGPYTGESRSTWTQTLTLPSVITAEYFYIVAATGTDKDDVDFVSAGRKYMGFKGQALGVPPVVTILTPDNEAISCEPANILSITGTVLSEEGTSVNDVSYEIKVTDSLNKNKALGTISSKDRDGNSNGSLKLTEGILGESAFVRFEIDAAFGTWYPEEGVSADGRKPSAGDVFKYVISVTGTTGSQGNDIVTVQIDKKKPEAKMEVSKLLESGGRNDCVNGDITVQCTLSDNNTAAESRIEITGSALSGPKTERFGEGDRNPVWEYDTTELPDENEYTITVYVKDTAGNEGSASRNIFVSQKTDRPVITFTNGTYFPDAKDWSYAVNGVNTFGTGSNNKVIFSFSDDDGLADVTLSVYDESGTLLPASKTEKQEGFTEAQNPVKYTINGSATKTVSYILPKTEAPYKIVVEAVDSEYKNGTEKNQKYRKTTADNYIVVSDSNFVIDLDTKEIQAKDEAAAVTGTLSVTDRAKIKEIHRYKAERDDDGKWQKVGSPQSSYRAAPASGETNSITVGLPSDAEKTPWTDTIASTYLTEGENNRFYYEATDTTGHKTFIYLTCKVDRTPPYIKVKTDTAEWNKSGAQTIEVIAKDEGAFASGISSVKAVYNRGDGSDDTSVELSRGAPCDEYGNTAASSDKKLYTLYSTTLTGIPDSQSFKVNITAADAVGNESRLEPSFKIDTTAPQFEAPPAITEGLVLTSDTSVSVTYTASDATSGIKTVEFSTDSSMKDEAGVKQSTKSDSGTFSYSLSHLSGKNATYTLYVRATDNAGNSTDSTAGTFIIDEKLPAVKITSPASGGTVNNTISFTGTVVEDNLSETNPVLKYKKQGDGAWTTAEHGSFTYSREGQNWTISGFDTKKLNDSKTAPSEAFDFRVTFTDAAGNEGSSEAYRLNIDQHSDRPVIKTAFSSDGGAFRHGEKTFSGSVSDDDGTVEETAVQIVPQGASIAADNWTVLSADKNEWSAEVSSDGIYDVYFKVTDSAGTEFSSGGESLAAPKISNNNTDTGSTFITVSIDTAPPGISAVQATKKQSQSEADAYETVLNNSFFGGAAYRYVRFRIDASDIVSQGEKLAVNVTVGEKKYPASYNSSDRFYYTANYIDMSGFTSGIYQFTVTATDEAGRASSFQRMITIDNTAPDTIKNVVPSAATQVTGEFEMTGLVQDDENANSGIPVSGAIWYYIPKDSERTYTSPGQLETLGWTTEKLTQSAVSWSIDFTGLAERLGYSKENEKLGDDYMYANDSSNPDLYEVPVWFRVVDNVGNVGYIQDNSLLFNPNADKPSVVITYPEMPDSGSLTMGGTVRLMGIASDNEGVDAVYLQFDFNDDGAYENGEGIDAAPKNDAGEVYVGGDYTNVAEPIPVKNGGMYEGFKAKGTVSWSSSVDLSQFAAGEKIRIRAVAVDNDTANGQLASAWSKELVIEVDNNTPQIEELKLIQYQDSSYSTKVKEVTYADDIFISGNNWRLEGKAVHRSGMQSVSVSQGNTVSTEDEPVGETGRKNKRFFIPIPDAGIKWSVTVTAVPDVTDSGYNSITTYSVQIDNDAPSLETDGEGLIIYRDSYGMSANRLGSAVHVQNSNGEYATITARLTEEGSGFERTVFYFVRTDKDGGEKRVYNVMKPCGDDRTENRAAVAATKTDGSVYINGENLAVLYKASVGRSDATTITIPDEANNDTIRAGGLVKIGGAYHRIIGKDSGSITLDAEVSTDFTTAEFVYGMVVDNSGESRNSNGSLKNDDGDGMVESYSKSGSNYTWDASVPSANIPDGPIEIHVVAFDKAGNASHASVKTRISNSPVRITSVALATDLNANGSFEPSEENQFFAIKNSDGSGNRKVGVDVWTLDTKKELYGDAPSAKYWTVKDRLAVTPEFVGGTAPFFCTFSKSETDELAEAEGYASGASGVITVENNTQFVLTNDVLNPDTCEGDDAVYRFSFWDSTEELTPGTDTSWTVLNARVKQELTDSVPPTASISPFYWKSSTENSLYENSLENGHIELEADLNNGSFTGSSGEYDKDPKVSGIIKVQGVANDNKILKEIKVRIPGFTPSGTYMTAGTYTPGSGWACGGSLETDGWAFAVDTDEITQAGGHTVSWTFTWNTAKISGTAAPDVTIEVQAVDQSSGTSADSGTQTAVGAETPFYRVDVVPYITKLFTGISNTAGEEFARSATGKYSVRSGETVRMHGFNLAPGEDNAEIGSMKVKTGAGDGTYVSLTVKPEAVSGAVSVTVNGITSLNNKNSNPVFASDTDDTVLKNEYNCRANRITNNRLTDDVELYIWDMGAFLTEINITSPMMKMDAQSNYYMSYGYGIPSMYVNKNGQHPQPEGKPVGLSIDYSYNKFHNTNVAFDDNGNIYALATNTDRVSNESAKFVFYTPSSKDTANQMPLPVDSGTGSYQKSSLSKRHLETVYNDSTKVYDINRVKNPKIATCTAGERTYIAIAYYDYNNTENPVKFRFGSRNGETITGGISGGAIDSKSIGSDMSESNDPSQNDSSAHGYHIVASSQTARQGGQYAACGIVPKAGGGYVGVVAWYDAAVRRLCYSYNENPDSAVVGGVWQDNAMYLDSEYTGWHIDMAVDSDGGIHIAYYSTARGDLKYAYLSRYDDTNPTVLTVDSYLSVGTNITVNIRREAGRQIPYIYYYNASSNQTPNSIKVAWQNDTSVLRDGAVNDKFTGAWESMTIPTENIPVDATVCGGVPTGGEYADTVVLGYMSDRYYEKAVLKK